MAGYFGRLRCIMFRLFRYGLIPIVLFCMVIVVASIDAHLSNSSQKSTWKRTTVSVMTSRDAGQALAQVRGTQNTFPDPYGTARYVVDGRIYTWEGRGRDIGLTAMNPGDQIEIYYNPANPQEINTLVLLGRSTGNIILAAAVAFLAFYVWFFWLRGRSRRSGPDNPDGAASRSFADSSSERFPGRVERAGSTIANQHHATIGGSPARRTFGQLRGSTLNKR